MSKVMKSFIYRGCLNPVTSIQYRSHKCNPELLDKSRYLADMMSLDKDADAAVEARI